MDVSPFYTSDSMKNLKVVDGECMTDLDYKLREAIRVAELHGVSIKDNIIPKRRNGIIVGYYVINEGGETAVATIE